MKISYFCKHKQFKKLKINTCNVWFTSLYYLENDFNLIV